MILLSVIDRNPCQDIKESFECTGGSKNKEFQAIFGTGAYITIHFIHSHFFYFYFFYQNSCTLNLNTTQLSYKSKPEPGGTALK